MEAYCMKCQKMVEMVGDKPDVLRNGNPVYKGKCKVCDNEIIRRRERK